MALPPFADSDNHKLRIKGFRGTATANTTTDIDYEMPEDRKLNGVMISLINHDEDDLMTFQVVDKNNVLGYGAGAVLEEFGSDWNVVSDTQNQVEIISQYCAFIYAGLFIRLKYTSVGLLNVKVKVNLFLHKKL